MKENIQTYWKTDPEVISYSLRDPMLYGDFRNAFNEDEPRFYEDLLDYEAVYSLFLEVRQETELISILRDCLSHQYFNLIQLKIEIIKL